MNVLINSLRPSRIREFLHQTTPKNCYCLSPATAQLWYIFLVIVLLYCCTSSINSSTILQIWNKKYIDTLRFASVESTVQYCVATYKLQKKDGRWGDRQTMPVAVSLSCLVVVCAVSYRRHHRLVLLEAVQCTSRWFWFTLQYPRSCFCNKQRFDWWGRSYERWNRSWLGYRMVQASGFRRIRDCCLLRPSLTWGAEGAERIMANRLRLLHWHQYDIPLLVSSTFPNEKMVRPAGLALKLPLQRETFPRSTLLKNESTPTGRSTLLARFLFQLSL